MLNFGGLRFLKPKKTPLGTNISLAKVTFEDKCVPFPRVGYASSIWMVPLPKHDQKRLRTEAAEMRRLHRNFPELQGYPKPTANDKTRAERKKYFHMIIKKGISEKHSG